MLLLFNDAGVMGGGGSGIYLFTVLMEWSPKICKSINI